MSLIESQRHLFEIPEDVAYFNVAGMSPLSKKVYQAGLKGLALKSQPWNVATEHAFQKVDMAREKFATLIQASPNDIAIVPSATYGVETALKNIKLNLGDEILVQAEEFPALILPLKKLSEKTGSIIKTVARPKEFEWTEAFLNSMNEKTRIVAFGLSHWTDGSTINPRVIKEKAKKIGATVLVDACQSLGAMPVSVMEIQPDYLFAPTYKWLMGPYTYGFLYVAPHLQKGEALEQYWASRSGAEDFATLADYNPNYLSGATRFDMSERSQFINGPMAIAALEQILEWQPTKISKTLEKMTDEIAEAAIQKKYIVAPKSARSPHFLGLKNKAGFTNDFKNSLVNKKIYLSFRGEWMRIAPHLYNNEFDIQRLIESI